jgi:hypothetical protein
MDVRSKVHGCTLKSTQTYATFWNTLWVIPGHMLQPFTHCVNSTGCMLGFGERLLLFGELVATLPYKCPLPSLLLHTILELWHAPRLPKLCELCDLERVVSLKEF